MNPKYIIIHHSATKDGATYDWAAITKYHVLHNGWDSVGYHWGVENVDGDYRIIPGRPESAMGAHCKDGGMNGKSLGICVVGNWDIEPPPSKQLEVTLNLVKGLMEKYKVTAMNVVGHREAQRMAGVSVWHRKTCPGAKFDMDEFRERLK